jgi:hypothetical protein
MDTTQKTTTKTPHKTDCAKAFGRLDSTCPRCRELAAGAQARKGWGLAYSGRAR